MAGCLQCFDTVGWVPGTAFSMQKDKVMKCWHGYLSRVSCKRFANGPINATATLSSLGALKSRMVHTFLVPSCRGCPGKEAIKQMFFVLVVAEMVGTTLKTVIRAHSINRKLLILGLLRQLVNALPCTRRIFVTFFVIG